MFIAVSLAAVSAQTSFAGTSVALAPVQIADGRLGFCDVLPGTPPGGGTTWAQLAYDAGARTNRWEFRWDRLEKQRGSWNFAADDPVVASDSAQGLATLGILIGTPGWAVASGQKPGNGVPAGLYLDPSDPRNLWAAYVRGTVSHYSGQVAAWEIWNEPDLSFFWNGTPRDYFRLLKVARVVIDSLDPTAKVVMAGMVAPDLGFFTKVLDASRADPGWGDNNGFFDITAWHAYGPARSVYDNVGRIRALLQLHGEGDKPIWVTEDGFPSSNPNGEPRQAAYVLQTVAYALAAGAAKVLVYRASDDPLPKTWGLMTASGQPRAGYVAFQVAAGELANAKAPVYAPLDHVERLVFASATSRITVLWNRDVTDRAVKIERAGTSATLVDWQGQNEPLQLTGNTYTVDLPGASYNDGIDPTGKVVGGPPLFLVESQNVSAPLPLTSYLRAATGAARQVLVLNSGTSNAIVRVADTLHPNRRNVSVMAPSTSKGIETNLLAGPDTDGTLRLSSTGPVSAWELAGGNVTPVAQPATTWSLAAVTSGLVLDNPAGHSVVASVTAFGPGGRERLTSSTHLAPHSNGMWNVPAGERGLRLSVYLEATGGILVWPSGSGQAAAVKPATAWFAISPRSRILRLFNPNSTGQVRAQVNFVGSGPIKSEQLEIGPHKTADVDSRKARAATVTSDSALIAGYTGQSGPSALVADATNRAALAVAGIAKSVGLFNPSSTTAHVQITVVSGVHSRVVTATVKPMWLKSVLVRKVSDGPRAVVVTSDVPVATAAES